MALCVQQLPRRLTTHHEGDEAGVAAAAPLVVVARPHDLHASDGTVPAKLLRKQCSLSWAQTAGTGSITIPVNLLRCKRFHSCTLLQSEPVMGWASATLATFLSSSSSMPGARLPT